MVRDLPSPWGETVKTEAQCQGCCEMIKPLYNTRSLTSEIATLTYHFCKNIGRLISIQSNIKEECFMMNMVILNVTNIFSVTYFTRFEEKTFVVLHLKNLGLTSIKIVWFTVLKKLTHWFW